MVKRKPKKTLTEKLRKDAGLRAATAVGVLGEEVERLKARCNILRKLRDVRIIRVTEPNGNLCGIYAVPAFEYEKKVEYFKKVGDELKMRFNQDLTVEVPMICDTMISVESEINSLNDVADESET